MMNCIYKGDLIIADNFILNGDEKTQYLNLLELKEASKNRQLICWENSCGLPIEFCHGEIRGNYFRHFKGEGSNCSYAKYYSNKSDRLRRAKIDLYMQLKNTVDAKVSIDEKIIENHRADIILRFSNSNIIAIEIIERSITSAEWHHLHSEYSNKNIKDIWILISDPSNVNKSIDMYLPDQMQFEEGIGNKTIYYSVDDKSITIKSKMVFNVKYPKLITTNIFTCTLSIDQFFIDTDGNIIGGFLDAHNLFQTEVIENYKKSVKIYLFDLENKRTQQEDAKKRREQILAVGNNHNERKIETNPYNKNENKSYNNFNATKWEGIFRAWVKRAANGENEYIDKIFKALICEGSDHVQLFKRLYEDTLKLGIDKYITVYGKVLDKYNDF